MKRFGLVLAGLLVSRCGGAVAQEPPLLPEKDVAALESELSGESAKRNLEGIARFHRQRGSQGFHSAAELVAERLRAYGLTDASILEFPADGKIFYGTQRSRPAWDAEFAELWQSTPEEESAGGARSAGGKNAGAGEKIAWKDRSRLASFEAEPATLAEDSESADVTAELVDVGAGTEPGDYANKEVAGKIVLVSAQPGAVQDLAVGKFGAVGIVSYAQNQKTAWSGDDQNLIRWGHLNTFSPNKTFAFMVSLKRAGEMQDWLARGDHLFALHAVVRAGQHPGRYEVVTATIPGSDAKRKAEEIAFSCHLDHQRPGANDNASGCATILEVARTLQKLTRVRAAGACSDSNSKTTGSGDANKSSEEANPGCGGFVGGGNLKRPLRTIRFIFPPEIEGTESLLNARPEFRKRIKAVIHMDMVGGGPETKAVFHVTRGPMSLPSFVSDVAWSFARWVNEQSYKYAATGEAQYPMIAPEGGKDPLRAENSPYSMGSDHDVYQDSSFGIPAIYLNDWPDRYIHTNFDSAANIDPTKLKRAAFIGAASGYFLASLSSADSISAIKKEIEAQRKVATAESEYQRRFLPANERSAARAAMLGYQAGALVSLVSFEPGSVTPEEIKYLAAGSTTPFDSVQAAVPKASGSGLAKFRRSPEPKGPLAVFGYDYFADHAKANNLETPKLLSYQGLWGGGEEYAYEVLNFANGQYNAQEIRDQVSAEYGPVELKLVVDYLRALEKIGIVEEVKQEPAIRR